MIIVSRAIDLQEQITPYGVPSSDQYLLSLQSHGRKSRYFIGCGEYSAKATDNIRRSIESLQGPSRSITFLKCQGLGSVDPWKNLSKDNPLPFTAYFDDFEDERMQLNLIHGDALPVNRGFYLASILTRASNQYVSFPLISSPDSCFR
jgi:hypothetical protein